MEPTNEMLELTKVNKRAMYSFSILLGQALLGVGIYAFLRKLDSNLVGIGIVFMILTSVVSFSLITFTFNKKLLPAPAHNWYLFGIIINSGFYVLILTILLSFFLFRLFL